MDLMVSKTEYAERISICEKCPHKTKFNICSLCKCLVILKAKFKDTTCPQSKWPNEEK